MKTAIVSFKDLDLKDLRAEHYVEASEDEQMEASLAGFTNGASGHQPAYGNRYVGHGRMEIRMAYARGHVAGTLARKLYLQSITTQPAPSR